LWRFCATGWEAWHSPAQQLPELVAAISVASVLSASILARRSSRRSHTGQRSRTHAANTSSPAVATLAVRTLPSFCVRTRPASSNTCRCCIAAASEMRSGSASRVTECGFRLSISTIHRLVPCRVLKNVFDSDWLAHRSHLRETALARQLASRLIKRACGQPASRICGPSDRQRTLPGAFRSDRLLCPLAKARS